jgi:hypothetical protein
MDLTNSKNPDRIRHYARMKIRRQKSLPVLKKYTISEAYRMWKKVDGHKIVTSPKFEESF